MGSGVRELGVGVRIRPSEGGRGQTQPGAAGQSCGDGGGPGQGQGCLAWQGLYLGKAGDVPCSLTGAGADGPGGWNGVLGHERGVKAPGHPQALHLQTDILISASATRNVTEQAALMLGKPEPLAVPTLANCAPQKLRVSFKN